MWNSEQRRRALSERLQQLATAVGDVESQPEQLTDGQQVLVSDLNKIINGVTKEIDSKWEVFGRIKDHVEREQSRQELCLIFEDLVYNLIQEIVPVLTGASANLVPTELEPVVQEQVLEAAPTRQFKPILFTT